LARGAGSLGTLVIDAEGSRRTGKAVDHEGAPRRRERFARVSQGDRLPCHRRLKSEESPARHFPDEPMPRSLEVAVHECLEFHHEAVSIAAVEGSLELGLR